MYYSLVVITPRRPQTFLCERDKFTNSERIASIFYVDWYKWEDSWEARLAQSGNWRAIQAPRIAKNAKKNHIGAHIWKTVFYIFPLLYIHVCLLCDEVVLSWKFGNSGSMYGPPVPPWILCKGPTWPRIKWKCIYFFIFFISTQKVLIRLLLFLTFEKLITPRRANAPNGVHRIHVRVCLRVCMCPSVLNTSSSLCVRLGANQLYNHCRCARCLSFWPWIRVVICVCDLVPINCTIIVDVQDTFHFDLYLISDPGQGHKNLVFSCMLCLNCSEWQLCHFLHVHYMPIITCPKIAFWSTCYSLWDEDFMTFWYPWIQHTVTRTPQKWNLHTLILIQSDYFHILHAERIALVWNLFQNVRGALKHMHVYKMFEFC